MHFNIGTNYVSLLHFWILFVFSDYTFIVSVCDFKVAAYYLYNTRIDIKVYHPSQYQVQGRRLGGQGELCPPSSNLLCLIGSTFLYQLLTLESNFFCQ